MGRASWRRAVCSGLFLLAGVLRLGFVAQFLSRPVMEGFVLGLAIFVTVSQVPKLFGITKGSGDTIAQFVHLIGHLSDTSALTLAVGAAAAVRPRSHGPEGSRRPARTRPRDPRRLDLQPLCTRVDIVGHVPSGLPTPPYPVRSADVGPLLAAAGGMVLVIFSESLGAADNFATKHGYEIDPNQELIALGVANAASGLVHGLAAAAACRSPR